MGNSSMKLRNLLQRIVNILTLNFSGNFLGTSNVLQDILERRRLFFPLSSYITLPQKSSWIGNIYRSGWKASESPGGSIKHRLLVPTLRAYSSASLGWGLRMCISHKFPGDAGAAGLGPNLENQWFIAFTHLVDPSLEGWRTFKVCGHYVG